MRLIAALLISIMLAPLALQLSVHSWYWANKAYISKVLCENRDKPMLHCDGKCVLAQKLKQAEQDQEKNSTPPRVEFSVSPFIVGSKAVIIGSQSISKLLWGTIYSSVSLGFLSDTFRPPPMH
ncbi:MAG: hypothetical protein R2813_00830 [Flavobacteriales bacterium]